MSAQSQKIYWIEERPEVCILKACPLMQQKSFLCAFATLLLFVNLHAQAQQSSEEFYGAPAPADFPQEEGVPVDD
ncbi:MAG: hypothetical protein ACKOF3_02270, partial [Spartobacteria bacterium]